ncbi:histone family protein [Methanobrevibacter sp. OttesenSCG-928-I08]|nr:histone family protein [Methanobrevibacter sp. OttesenSCG-928-I08]
MSNIPKAPIGRIMKEAGAERISEDAKDELTNYLEEVATNVTVEAKKAAEFAKRKTIKADDIKLAIKNL